VQNLSAGNGAISEAAFLVDDTDQVGPDTPRSTAAVPADKGSLASKERARDAQANGAALASVEAACTPAVVRLAAIVYMPSTQTKVNARRCTVPVRGCMPANERVADAQAAQMEACKGSLRELLELQADVKAYARGLAELSTSYKPSLDETDFAAELDNRAARAHRSMRCAA
jgi:hypothetical protein